MAPQWLHCRAQLSPPETLVAPLGKRIEEKAKYWKKKGQHQGQSSRRGSAPKGLWPMDGPLQSGGKQYQGRSSTRKEWRTKRDREKSWCPDPKHHLTSRLSVTHGCNEGSGEREGTGGVSGVGGKLFSLCLNVFLCFPTPKVMIECLCQLAIELNSPSQACFACNSAINYSCKVFFLKKNHYF